MMSEIGKIHRAAKIPLGGDVLTNKIQFYQNKDLLSDWFLMAFKAGDKDHEAWTGFHSPNIMVVVTEASGIEQETFDAIEGLLTGNSKLLLIFNPVRTTGEAYQSTRSPQYKKFKLSCLNAPNVRAKKVLIPGQVDYTWVSEKVDKWALKIDKAEVDESQFDFKFNGEWYRPNDLFRVKVLGEFPKEAEGQLIPLSWVEMAVERWHNSKRNGDQLDLGVDVAGMGRDNTCLIYRYGMYTEKVRLLRADKSDTTHMTTAGIIKNELAYGGTAYIDTIGEGAGVYSRLTEQGVNAVSVKGSFGADGLNDETGEMEFINMRAYLHWCLRDMLNPQFKHNLCLPPDDELIQEITEPTYQVTSSGKIQIEAKEEIKKRLGRSPDKLDALLNTFFPKEKPKTNTVSFNQLRVAIP
ncbi:MAG: hypothetical protein PHW12_03345 [Smithella sp.]|nr:hypothetical protein [Smithella sp.]